MKRLIFATAILALIAVGCSTDDSTTETDVETTPALEAITTEGEPLTPLIIFSLFQVG